MDQETINKLKYLIGKKKTLEEIKEVLGLETYVIYGLVQILKEEGRLYDIIDGQPVKVKAPFQNSDVYHIEADNQEQFCFVSDPHYGSKYDRPDIMRAIYQECDERGITSIFCCGDLTDGYYPNRQNHVYELKAVGADQQTEYVVNTHPYSDHIKFYTITGNHDFTHERNDGFDIGKAVAKERSDIVYLGQDQADVQVGRLKIRMYHGKGKNAYAKSYKAQRYFETISQDERPDILQLGHIHESFYMNEDDCHILQTGALLDQTPYARQQGMRTERSCWFVTIGYDGRGKISKIIPELQKFGPSTPVRTRKKKYY